MQFACCGSRKPVRGLVGDAFVVLDGLNANGNAGTEVDGRAIHGVTLVQRIQHDVNDKTVVVIPFREGEGVVISCESGSVEHLVYSGGKTRAASV